MPDSLNQIVTELKHINSSLSHSYDWVANLISTLAGVFVGGYLSYFYQTKGKLKVYLHKAKFSFLKVHDPLLMESKRVNLDEHPDNGIITFQINVINSKLVTEYLVGIQLQLIHGANFVELEFHDLESPIEIPRGQQYEKFNTANIPAKSVITYNLKSYLNRKDLDLLLSSPTLFFTYRSIKNKVTKVPLLNFLPGHTIFK